MCHKLSDPKSVTLQMVMLLPDSVSLHLKASDTMSHDIGVCTSMAADVVCLLTILELADSN